jgi:hypothetical protein
MDIGSTWEWLRPMIGFFLMGVFLVVLVYLFVRGRRKKESPSVSDK